MDIGKSLKQAQLNHGISNIDLAKALNVSEELISKLRNNKMATVRYRDLEGLAGFFDLAVSDFIRLGEDK